MHKNNKITQEDKELLLKDLCTRLPHGVKGRVYAETTNGDYDINGDMIFFDSPFDVILDEINTSTEEIHVVAIGNEDTVDFIEDQQVCGIPYTIDEFKPYLRPMSSMTEEEKIELQKAFNIKSSIIGEYGISSNDSWYVKDRKEPLGFDTIRYTSFSGVTDYLNSIHVDYRGLIPKGLALEAPKDMYNIK